MQPQGHLLTNSNRQLNVLQGIQAVALDLDGVVYLGNQPLPGAVGAVQALRAVGLRVCFVTNNSGRTRADIAARLTSMGIPAQEDEVFTSAYAASRLMGSLRQQATARVMVLGTDGLRAELVEQGAQIVTSGPCEFVIVGIDRTFNYEKLCAALDALLAGAMLIACNRDANFPSENGRLLPGSGPLVAAVECAWGHGPAYVAGKPNSMLLEMVALAKAEPLKPSEILVVGDGIQSDIAMASCFGSPSALIWLHDGEWGSHVIESEYQPTLVLRSLADLPAVIFSVKANSDFSLSPFEVPVTLKEVTDVAA